jgi:hypothetical protein
MLWYVVFKLSFHILLDSGGNEQVTDGHPQTTLNEWAVPIGSNNITIHLDASLGPNATNS